MSSVCFEGLGTLFFGKINIQKSILLSHRKQQLPNNYSNSQALLGFIDKYKGKGALGYRESHRW